MSARDPKSTKPNRYRCKIGGEWKSLQAFSKNQQRLLQRQIDCQGSVDAANSGMACLEHSAAFRGELRCDLCDLIKPYDDYSKSQRKLDTWTANQEPGVIPTHLEKGHVSIEELGQKAWHNESTESTSFFSNDSLPRAPISSFASLGLDDKLAMENLESPAPSAASTTGRGPSSVVSSIPPHLANRIMSKLAQNDNTLEAKGSEGQNQKSSSSVSSSDVTSESDVSRNRQQRQSAFIANALPFPPHLRRLGSNAKSGAGSATFRSNTSSISTATTMRDNQAKIPYNAWDNSGQRHELAKSQTTSSDHDTCSASNDPDTNHASGNWDDVPVTKQNMPPRRKGGWHKAPMMPREQQVELPARHLNPDVDRRRRINYCESEDSDY
ncbi:hypothetical protein QQS21_010571 [Conoideocrella luteorostrata]|uniref:Stc1 domain-containing protein n=1 Tax=Conoideocrella luteorostrata TaxID=1105319 RepID=A0AAJ0FWR2_9HYPO|nr:hypothetical protein QQS21_010571 [Conoideocrella luteorostrata]